MLRHVLLILCVMSTVVMATGPASGATITNISALGGGNGYPYGAADGINASGQVTGCMQFSGTYTRLCLHRRDKSVQHQLPVRDRDDSPRHRDQRQRADVSPLGRTR